MNDQLQIKPRLLPINETATSNHLEHAEKLINSVCPILDSKHTFRFCTIRAAIDDAIRFNTMTDDLAPAVIACWCQQMNGTFKGIEHIEFALHVNCKRLVVIITANAADCQGYSPTEIL